MSGNVTEKAGDLKVEVPDPQTYIKGLAGLLFSRSPQITATPVIPNYGERLGHEAVCNVFLAQGRREWRFASTMAMLSGISFIRLVPSPSDWGPTSIRPIATRGADVIVDRGATTLTLTWSPVTTVFDVGGAGPPTTISHYEVYASDTPMSRSDLDGMTPVDTPLAPTTDVPLPSENEYYSVLAVDTRGNKSPL